MTYFSGIISRGRTFILFCSLCLGFVWPTTAQHTPQYEQVKKELANGWNTWSTYSMASHVLLPQGATLNLALLKRSKNSDGFVNRFFVDKKANGWKKPIVKPGYHSYNGDYTQLDIEYRKVRFRLESAAYGDTLYLLVTPSKTDPQYPLVLIWEGGLMWNSSGGVSREGNDLVFSSGDTKYRFSTSNKVLEDPFINSLSPYLAMTLDQPIGLSNGTKDLSEIQSRIEHKRKTYLKYISQYEKLAEAYAGMAASLAWNTIYDPRSERVFSTVDRGWNVSRGGYVFFGWDNFFQAQMIAFDNAHLGMANAIEALNEVTEEGYVSNQSQANGRKSWDRSQPPVGSIMCWEIYQRHSEQWFLEEVFPKLLRWNEWWLERRMNGKLLSWGSHKDKNPFFDSRYNNLKAAMLETGIDDSPMYEGIGFDEKRGVMELHDVGLNAMYIADCEALAKMAEALGKKDEAKALQKRASTFRKAMKALWNESNGLYQNYDLRANRFSDRISPTSFYPMLAKTATEKQAQRMVREHMLNEQEFWGEWILPSISKTDPLYPKQKYWKGAIWAPMNFLVYLGMREYDGLKGTRELLAEKSVEIFLRNWEEKGFVCENYSPIDGSCTHERLQSSSWYTWGGLMAVIGLMEAGY